MRQPVIQGVGETAREYSGPHGPDCRHSRQSTRAPRELLRARAPQARLAAQPAKTTLFAGVKVPGLRANFFAPINDSRQIN